MSHLNENLNKSTKDLEDHLLRHNKKKEAIKLTPFYYKTRPMGGEDGRHILVWGRLQDAEVRQTTFLEYNSQTGSMKVPVVCDGALAWVTPTRLTLLECGGAQPPEEWINIYLQRVLK